MCGKFILFIVESERCLDNVSILDYQPLAHAKMIPISLLPLVARAFVYSLQLLKPGLDHVGVDRW